MTSVVLFVPWSGYGTEEGGNKVGGEQWFLLPLPCLGHTLLKMVSWIQDGYSLVTAGSGREIGKF